MTPALEEGVVGITPGNFLKIFVAVGEV